MQHESKAQTVLDVFCYVRSAIVDSQFIELGRHIIGTLQLTGAILPAVQSLVDADQAEVRISNRVIVHLADASGQQAEIKLKIVQLQYYENTNDLIRFTSHEPIKYYVYGIGAIEKGKETTSTEITAFRETMRARDFLRSLADYDDKTKLTFLVPEKLEIKLVCRSLSFEPLINLAELSSHFDKNPQADAAEREQRLVLFRRVLKEYLKTHPPDQRLDIFASNFHLIYESYTRDYQLWIGSSFGELEKAFEEKRLKFIADLNGILSGVQTSILAVPIAAILLGDKFDFAAPTKNFFLATAVSVMGAIALKLLANQDVTLKATRGAIDATKSDFEKKHNKRKEEFKTRLQNLDDQELRVKGLLKSLQAIISGIIALSFLAWLASACWPLLQACNSGNAEPDKSVAPLNITTVPAPTLQLNNNKPADSPKKATDRGTTELEGPGD